MAKKLSVIIPTYNSFKNKQGSIELTASSIFTQESSGDFETIIVDDGSNDKTRKYLDILKDKNHNFDLRIISKKHDGNKGKSRNIGVQVAKSELILFLDDDMVLLSPNCVKRVIEIWKPKTFMCGAKRYWTHPIWDGNEILKLIRDSNFEDLKKMSFVPKGLNRYNGCRDLLEFSFLSNFGVVSREDFLNLGGFDENYTGWGYEETDLMFRLFQDEIKFINLHSMIDVLHLNHPLGKSETDLTYENRDRYHAKTHNAGVIFKVNHLFNVFENDGTDIFIKYNLNCTNRLKKLGSTIDNQEKEEMYESSRHKYKDTEISVFEFKHDCFLYYLESKPAVSIIVPTYNSFELRNGSIELVLASLEKQKYGNYEIIIVDDGSTDQSKYFVFDYGKKNRENLPFRLKYIKLLEHSGNRSKCRNIGVSKARSNLLLFLDDDTVFLSDNFLSEIISLYQPSHFLCGAKRFWSFVSWDRNLFLRAIKTQSFELIENKYILPLGINRRKGFRDLFEYSFLANCGLVAKTDFLNVGGFDETTFDGWGREDVDLMLRLYLNNIRFINLHEKISVLHLNHSIKREDTKKRDFYFQKYEESEKRHGYIFKVNHLYGVFENDGTDILIPTSKGSDR